MDKQRFDLPDSDIVFIPNFLTNEEGDKYFVDLFDHVKWKLEQIQIRGTLIDLPRLTAWYGDPGKVYTYSGIRVEPMPWLPSLLQIKQRIEQYTKSSFNSVLLNHYRNHRDSVGWHADDERELGEEPEIASLSLGMARQFHLKHRTLPERTRINLTHGSLLIMRGKTQKHWLHCIPKSVESTGPRINLTFRTIL